MQIALWLWQGKLKIQSQSLRFADLWRLGSLKFINFFVLFQLFWIAFSLVLAKMCIALKIAHQRTYIHDFELRPQLADRSAFLVNNEWCHAITNDDGSRAIASNFQTISISFFSFNIEGFKFEKFGSFAKLCYCSPRALTNQ